MIVELRYAKNMSRLFLALLLTATFIGCKNSEKEKESIRFTQDDKREVDNSGTVTLARGCYLYNDNGNTITLEILETGEDVLGKLTYALKEKDVNTGTFKGCLKIDKLIGDYTFRSEGQESVREVAFLVQGDRLIEGYSELDMKENKLEFINVDAINYNSTMPLTKTACE